jgi:hypothetical protein
VLIDRSEFLATLDVQTIADVEVITWNDHAWLSDIEAIAADHRWSHRRVATKQDAIATAKGRYVAGWGVADAEPSALTELVAAADRDPEARGALSANFDPMIVWRRDEFFGKTDRSGLAQADVYAFDGGGGTLVHPT